MSIVNAPKPTTSIANTSRPGDGETWASILTTWATEIRSWLSIGSFLSNSSLPASIVDSYSENNQDSWQRMTQTLGAQRTDVGQVFTTLPSRGILVKCKFYLRKGVGSPTGNATAKLFAITGTVGTNAVPTGSVLATSDTLDVTTLSSTFSLYTFTFATSYVMEASTSYAIVFSYPSGTDSNAVDVGVDASSPTHSGNNVVSVDSGTSWTAASGTDTIFYLYGTNSSFNNTSKPI